MKLYELMYEQQPPKQYSVREVLWKKGGGWFGWLVRHFSLTGDHADFNRKI